MRRRERSLRPTRLPIGRAKEVETWRWIEGEGEGERERKREEEIGKYFSASERRTLLSSERYLLVTRPNCNAASVATERDGDIGRLQPCRMRGGGINPQLAIFQYDPGICTP